jgi:microcystin-dependent protein
MQGNVPVHTGANQPGPGLSNYVLGETGGSETVSLLQSEMPSHSHAFNVDAGDVGEERIPTDRALARTTAVGGNLYGAAASLVTMNALPPAGGDQPHNNMQPYLTLNFCIAMQGIFPARP